jgi:hypothetical protein
MRDTRRCLATGQRHDTRHCSGRDRRLARIARLVAQPSIRPRFGETLLLAPNHRPTDIHPSRHLLHRPTIRRSKNDLRTLDMLAWQVAIRSNRLKSPSVRRAQPNAYCLCHPRSFARRQLRTSQPHCESAECVSAQFLLPRLGRATQAMGSFCDSGILVSSVAYGRTDAAISTKSANTGLIFPMRRRSVTSAARSGRAK